MVFQKGHSIRKGMTHSEETKKKISESRKGYKMSAEVKEKISESSSGSKNHMFGKHHSDETKSKLSKANTGKKLSDDHKKKISDSLKGRSTWNKGVKMWDTQKHPMTGKIPWNKGIPRTDEVKAKLSAANTGKKLSDDHRANISKGSLRLSGEAHPMYGKHHTREAKRKIGNAQIGDKHHNWKGGITSTINNIRTSPAYNSWRQAVFYRDGYTCQMCGQIRGQIQAHHIKPVRDHKNDLLIFDVDNGITLCERCHMSITHHENDYVDEFTNIVNNNMM